VVAENLRAVLRGGEPTARYGGYAGCPITVGGHKVFLTEADYTGEYAPKLPFRVAKPRRSMWLLKRFGLAPLYWYGMPRGPRGGCLAVGHLASARLGEPCGDVGVGVRLGADQVVGRPEVAVLHHGGRDRRGLVGARRPVQRAVPGRGEQLAGGRRHGQLGAELVEVDRVAQEGEGDAHRTDRVFDGEIDVLQGEGTLLGVRQAHECELREP